MIRISEYFMLCSKRDSRNVTQAIANVEQRDYLGLSKWVPVESHMLCQQKLTQAQSKNNGQQKMSEKA